MFVAVRASARLQDRLTDKPIGEMTKRDAVKALWRLRGVVDDPDLPGSHRARDVVLAGHRVKKVIRAAEEQLGVAGAEPAASAPAPANQAAHDAFGAPEADR